VLVTDIDGFPVESRQYPRSCSSPRTYAVRSRIATLLSDDGLNIATLRQKKGGDAFMVIELDDYPDEQVRDHIRALPWVRWAFRLDKVSA
jgi:L-serine dehydratase